MSGLGGAELRFDEWDLDYVLTGSQKALALPPGLAFAVASEPFIAAAHHGMAKGVYFDLVEHEQAVQKRQAPNTPAISLYYALEQQLRQHHRRRDARPVASGISRWRSKTWQWVANTRDSLGIDLRVLAPEAKSFANGQHHRTPVFIRGDDFVAAVAQHGFTIGTGYGKLEETTFDRSHGRSHQRPVSKRASTHAPTRSGRLLRKSDLIASRRNPAQVQQLFRRKRRRCNPENCSDGVVHTYCPAPADPKVVVTGGFGSNRCATATSGRITPTGTATIVRRACIAVRIRCTIGAT